jgi:hypothetical protein
MSENFGVKPGFEPTSTQSGEGAYNNLVENHAAQLMDELFNDLDRTSGSLEQPSTNPSTPKSIPSAAGQLALAVKTDELQDNLFVPYVEMDAILEPFYAVEPASVSVENDQKSLASFLVPGLAWGAFLGSISLFAFTQLNIFTRSPDTVQAAVPTVATAQPQDVAFATEVSELLQSTENVLPSPAPLTVNALPTIAQPTVPAVASLATQPLAIQSLVPTPPRTIPPQKGVGVAQKLQAHSAIQIQKSQKTQTIALSALNNRLPVLNGNQNQIATSYIPPTLPSSLTPESLPMGRQAKSGVTINTILDLGGPKSAILISRNGSTQNIHPGEVLDATGWVFVQVKNGQAILQRGNETRAVGIGEQF